MLVGMTLKGESPGNAVDRRLDIEEVEGDRVWIGIRQPDKDTAEWAIYVPKAELKCLARLLRAFSVRALFRQDADDAGEDGTPAAANPL